MKRLIQFKGLSVILLTMTACFFLFNCAAKKSEPWGNEKTGFMLEYRPEVGTTLKYKMKSEGVNILEVPGAPQESTTNSEFEIFYTAKNIAEDNTITLGMGYNSLVSTSSGPQGENTPDMSQYIGKELEVKLSPTGKYLEMKNQELFPPAGESSVSMAIPLRTFFFSLSEQPVKINESWTDTDSYTDKAGENEITTNTSSKFTVLEKVMRDNVECLKISFERNSEIKGKGVAQGFEYTMTGTAKNSGELFFVFKEGYFNDVNSEGTMEATISIEAMGMEIPMNVTSKATFKLIK